VALAYSLPRALLNSIGSFNVDSAGVGEGTTFRVKVPLFRDEGPEAAETKKSQQPKNPWKKLRDSRFSWSKIRP